MDSVIENAKSERDLIDFFVAAGDNLYPTIPEDP